MDKVLIGNKYYDPYFILSVTPDDSLTHITKAFRAKAKVLHPDKFKMRKDVDIEKINKHFRILLECYQYIVEKRREIFIKREEQIEYQNEEVHEQRQKKKCNLNDFGYGETERLKSIEDYDNTIITIQNILKHKKFNLKTFNKLFEFNEQLQKKKEDIQENEKALIQKTQDGFYGYNSGNSDENSLVSSFNGILIIGDELGESGKGYYGKNYSDLKKSFSSAKNLDKLPIIPKNFQTQQERHTAKNITIDEYLKNRTVENQDKSTYNDQLKTLFNKKKESLKEKIENDKKFIEKYGHIYDSRLLEDAKLGRLKTSSDYVHSIDDNLSYEENLMKNRMRRFLE